MKLNYMNKMFLERLTDKGEIENMSIDSMYLEDAANVPLEFLNTLNQLGIPPPNLALKRTCIIMLMRNLEWWSLQWSQMSGVISLW